jgi:hypothetical protein
LSNILAFLGVRVKLNIDQEAIEKWCLQGVSRGDAGGAGKERRDREIGGWKNEDMVVYTQSIYALRHD